MTSDRLIRVCVLVALVAVTLEARGGQEVRQDVRIATSVGGAGIATPGVSPVAATPLAPITSTGSGLIIGRVIDAGTGRPVGGALVAIGGSGPAAPARTMVVNAPGGGQPMAFSPPGPSMPRLMTDGEGRFVFRNLPKGSFNLTAVKPGYVDGAYGRLRPNGASQALELAEGERLNDVTIRVFRFATISGSVSDQTGDPAVAVQVRAFRRGLSGGRRILSPAGTVMTDDRGAYRLFNLIPGEYVISVPSVSSSVPANMQLGGRGGLSPDLLATAMSGGTGEFSIGTGGTQVGADGRFLLQPGMRGSTGSAPDASGRLLVPQTAYHPSASTVGQAQPVTVASGEERSGVDVTLKLVPSVTISGRVVGPTGPAESYMLHLTPTDTGEMSTDPDVATAVTAADGSFTFFGVPAGQYVIQTIRVPRPGVMGATTMIVNQGGGNMSFTSTTMSPAAGAGAPPPPTEPTLWTATPVTIGAMDITELTIVLNTGLKISGRTEFQGSAERPPADRLAQVNVMLESADGKTRTGPLTSRLQANGLFTTAGVPPGKYLLRVLNPPGGWDVRSIMLGGLDAADTPVDLDDKDLAGALLTFTDRLSSVSGTVKAAQGAQQAAADSAAAVVIFPTDNRAWMYNNPRRVRLTRASKSGTYTFTGLPDGDYFLIAIPEEVANEWQDPRFLEIMSREATRVTIVEGDKRTQDLERKNIRPDGGRGFPADAGRGFSPGTLAGPEGPAHIDQAGADDEPSDVGRGFSPGTLAGPEGPAYTAQQQTRDPRATPARDRAAESTGTGSIAGVVLQDDSSNTPMRRARVTLRRSDSPVERATMTDESGRFAFTALPDGRYTLLAGKAAYLTVYHGAARAGRGPGSPIALAAGQQLGNLVVRMPRGAVVTGMVTDQFGVPVPNVGIRFMQSQMSGGERRLVPVPSSGSVTDDRGIYRAYGLMPGSYVVSVVPQPQSNAEIRQLSQSDLQTAMNDLRQQPGASAPARPASSPSDIASAIVPGRSVGYAPVYYPGTTVQAEAGQVTVGPGQELTGVDLPMRLVPTAKIEGTVLGPDGRPAGGAMVMAFPVDLAPSTGSRSFSSDQEGKFSLTNVAPGRYTLISRGGGVGPGGMAVGERMVFIPAPPGIGGGGAMPPPPPPPPPPPGGATLYAEQEIDVSGEDLSGLSLTLQPGMTVSGRIVFESKNGTAPPDFNQIRVLLSSAAPNRVTMGTPPGMVDASGSFVIQGVPPGQYRFATTVPPTGPTGTGWTMKSAVVGGRDAIDTPLDIKPGGNIEGITITYSDLVSEISGTLSDGKGKPISDLSILVFTTERSLWGTASRRLRPPIQPASDGKFRITGLPAGEYFLGAVTDLEPGDWQDPAFLEQLSAAAIKVTLAEGEKKVQDIKIAGG